MSRVAPPPSTASFERRHLQLFLSAKVLSVRRELVLRDPIVGGHCSQLGFLRSLDVRLVALELDLVANLSLELVAQLLVDDEHLGDLRDLDRDAPGVRIRVADRRFQRRPNDSGQRGLALLDALDHRHVRHRVTQLAQGDVSEQRVICSIPDGSLKSKRPAAAMGSVMR